MVHDAWKINWQNRTWFSRRRIGRLMNQAGLWCKTKKKFKVTTDSKHNKAIAPNLLNRQFTVTQPDRYYVGDITYGAPILQRCHWRCYWSLSMFGMHRNCTGMKSIRCLLSAIRKCEPKRRWPVVHWQGDVARGKRGVRRSRYAKMHL